MDFTAIENPAPILLRAVCKAEQGAHVLDGENVVRLQPGMLWICHAVTFTRGVLQKSWRNGPEGGKAVACCAGQEQGPAGSSKDRIINFLMAFSTALSTILPQCFSTFINPPQTLILKMGQSDTWMD